MTVLRPLLVVGTRPEAIKMAPVILACQRNSGIEPVVCFTGQHREMLAQVADYFAIKADVNLDVMSPNQTLTSLTIKCLQGLDDAVSRFSPNCIVAQGDTTTVLAASMVSFYRKLPFVHVEAGLRTGDLQSPWPEEYNRRVAGLATNLHCAPTQRSADNLLREGVPSGLVHVTGNTVIDALLMAVGRERQSNERWQNEFNMLGDQRVVLITGHRRENFGDKFESICRAIATLAQRFTDVQFVYPVHLNPNVRDPVYRILGSHANVHLLAPAIYPAFVWLMDRSYLILTDSGGVQEEAPSLKKPVLVMRDTTERPEAVDAGAVQLVGTEESAIVDSVTRLLTDPAEYRRRQLQGNPYGDGKSAQRIVELMESRAWEQTEFAKFAA